MSVTTRADEQRDLVVELFDKIICDMQHTEELLEGITNPDTWGWSDFSQEYQQKLLKTHKKILKMKLKLRRIRNDLW